MYCYNQKSDAEVVTNKLFMLLDTVLYNTGTLHNLFSLLSSIQNTVHKINIFFQIKSFVFISFNGKGL